MKYRQKVETKINLTTHINKRHVLNTRSMSYDTNHAMPCCVRRKARYVKRKPCYVRKPCYTITKNIVFKITASFNHPYENC